MSIRAYEVHVMPKSMLYSHRSCADCFGEATRKALFERENEVIVQYYCDSCIPKAEFD